MKMQKIAMLACTLFTVLHTNNAIAEGSVAAKIGTLGAGLEYVHPIGDKFAISLGINGVSYDDSVEESDINYDADLNMKTISLLGDYHPTGTGFRITAGIMNNSNEFDLVGTPTGSETVDINGTTYTAEDIGSLKATLGFEEMAPYIGIGWGHAPNGAKGWGFDMDIGVLFQGEPDASLTAVCGDRLNTSSCNTLQANVAEEEVSLQSDAEDFDLYPVVSLGVSYKF